MANVWANSMACHLRATCHIAGCCHLVTWWIHCHDSRATCHTAGCSHLAKSMCHIAGCNNSIRHIQNRFCAIFYFIFVINAVWSLTRGGFRIVSGRYTCFKRICLSVCGSGDMSFVAWLQVFWQVFLCINTKNIRSFITVKAHCSWHI